jgi:hypothetical protein
VFKGHHFMLQQLQAHGSKEGMAQLVAEYQALGAHLPSQELVNKSYRSLAKHLHSDKNALGSELMQQLNNAKEALSKTDSRSAMNRP